MTHADTLDRPHAAASIAAANATAPRYDIYRNIHKALRREMCETLVQLGQADLTHSTALAAITHRIVQLCRTLRDHVAHERDHVLQALAAVDAQACRRNAHEHEDHLVDLAEIEQATANLRAAEAATRGTLGLQLYRHLALFVAANLEHMHVEETALNAALWAHFSDDEIAAIEGRILASMTPEVSLASLRSIAGAISVQELIDLLAGVQASAPPEAFGSLLQALGADQEEQRWTFVLQSLMVQPPSTGARP